MALLAAPASAQLLTVDHPVPLFAAQLQRQVAMVAEIVAERERTSFLVTAALDEVYMMTMRPRDWSMEERAKRIVGVRRVNVAGEGSEDLDVGRLRRHASQWR